MEQRIIRISLALHSDFKQMVSKYPKHTLSSAAELLIANALRRGEIAETKENAYKAVKELEQVVKSWIKQQEKMFLSRIGEDILSLAHQLKGTATAEDIKSEILENKRFTKEIAEALLKSESKYYEAIIQLLTQLSEKIDQKPQKKSLF